MPRKVAAPHPAADARPTAQPSPEPAPTRRLVQDRSRARQEHILDAAVKLLMQGGSEHLRMSDIARQAGISIGSLYQYFPDKAALMQTLARRHFQASRRCIEQALAGADSLPALREAFGRLLHEYLHICAHEPVVREVWSGLQADPALRDIERQASAECGRLLAQALARVRPTGADESATAFLVWHLGEAVVRLAMDQPPGEAERLLAAYRQMVDAAVFDRPAG